MDNNEFDRKPWQNDINSQNGADNTEKPWNTESDIPKEVYNDDFGNYKAPEPEKPQAEEQKPDYSYQYYEPYNYPNGRRDDDNNKPKKKKSGGGKFAAWMAVICTLCVLGLAAIVVVLFINGWKYDDNVPNPDTDKEQEVVVDKKDKDKKEEKKDDGDTDIDISIKPSDGKALDYNQIYKKCAPASVGILVSQKSVDFYGRTYESKYVGSGFIIDKKGYIATNAHVVSGMDTIKVYLHDGTEVEAKLIGCDTFSDIAVVKIESDKELTVVEFGDSSVLEVGDAVSAIGTPADITLAGTFTHGIISAVDRKVVLTDQTTGINKTMRLLQTDATINPGNSGGPLINSNGQVIGINTLKLTDTYEGIGFAIPSVYAEKVVEAIIKAGKNVSIDPENEYVTIDEEPQMGIANSQDITESISAWYHVPQGVQILLLDQDCSLAKNGAMVGDIITKFNGVEIKNVEELRAERDKVKPRQKATVTVYRNGKYMDITFTMGSNIDTNN